MMNLGLFLYITILHIKFFDHNPALSPGTSLPSSYETYLNDAKLRGKKDRLYCAAAEKLFSRITNWQTEDSTARKEIMDRTIRRMQSVGIWDKLDIMYCFYTFDDTVALLNWVKDDFNGINEGATFLVDSCFVGNAEAGAKINTTFIPSLHADEFKRNSIFYGAHFFDGDSVPFQGLGGGTGGRKGKLTLSGASDNTFYTRANDLADTTGYTNYSLSDRLISIVRRSSANYEVYEDTTLKNKPTVETTRITDDTLFIFSDGDTTASYFSSSVAFYFVGRAITPAQLDSLTDIIDSYFIMMRRLTHAYVGIIGNSTIAKSLTEPSVSSLMNDNKYHFVDVAAGGATINMQLTSWEAADSSAKANLQYVFIEIGLNDCKPATPIDTTLSQYQTLVNHVIEDAPDAKIVLCTMIPCKQRFTDLGWEPGGYQKWCDINEAIMGGGATPITGAHYRINGHSALLNDGSDNLKPEYDSGDHIHQNTNGRQIIADIWEAVIASEPKIIVK